MQMPIPNCMQHSKTEPRRPSEQNRANAWEAVLAMSILWHQYYFHHLVEWTFNSVRYKVMKLKTGSNNWIVDAWEPISIILILLKNCFGHREKYDSIISLCCYIFKDFSTAFQILRSMNTNSRVHRINFFSSTLWKGSVSVKIQQQKYVQLKIPVSTRW